MLGAFAPFGAAPWGDIGSELLTGSNVWTTPQTWVDGTVYDETTFNEQIRDNLNFLRHAIDDDGKFNDLTGASLANLDGTNVTGLFYAADDNEITAKHNFDGGSAKLIIPVGTDLFGGTGGNKTAGSIWIEGTEFHYVDSAQEEWLREGSSVSTPAGAIPGSFWIETDELHYIDAAGDERKMTSETGSAHAGAIYGSMWIDDTVESWGGSPLLWINSNTKDQSIHVDSHADSAHTNSHSNTAHTDSHGNSHSNTAHTDNHSNVAAQSSHGNSHTDHFDAGLGGHVNTHTNSHTNAPHSDSHSNIAHTDSHSNSHSDVAHVDSHTNLGHSDSHSDAPTNVGP